MGARLTEPSVTERSHGKYRSHRRLFATYFDPPAVP